MKKNEEITYLRLCAKMAVDARDRDEAEKRLVDESLSYSIQYNVLLDSLVAESRREEAAVCLLERAYLDREQALALVPVVPAACSWRAVTRARRLGATLSALFDAARSINDDRERRRLEFMALVATSTEYDDLAVDVWLESGVDLDDLVSVARANLGESSERAGAAVLHSDDVTDDHLSLLSGDDAPAVIRSFAPLLKACLDEERKRPDTDWVHDSGYYLEETA
jgi:hypothetical protein